VIHNKIRSASPFRLLALALMGLVIFYLGAGFVHQANVSHQRREELHRIQQDIETVRQANARLEGQLNYVRSPEAAEEWARQNGWAKEDEVSVVVVAPAVQPSPAGGLGPDDEAAPGSNRKVWWDLFFGER
jgi:cell division protein FtsB